MQAYPAEIHSRLAELGVNDDTGHKFSSCGTCDECGNTFEEHEPIIVFNDHSMHKQCAKDVRDALSAEIAKYPD